jgi:hypothetical protein
MFLPQIDEWSRLQDTVSEDFELKEKYGPIHEHHFRRLDILSRCLARDEVKVLAF